ncbi:RNase H family protein [Undibacterium arcticum]
MRSPFFTDHKTICDVLARDTRAKCEKGRNSNQWNQLRQLCRTRQISLNWVRGHAGNVGNTLADRAARSAAKSISTTIGSCELSPFS